MRLEWCLLIIFIFTMVKEILNRTLPHKPNHSNISLLTFIGYSEKTLNAVFIMILTFFKMIIEEFDWKNFLWLFLITFWRFLMNSTKPMCTYFRIYPFVQVLLEKMPTHIVRTSLYELYRGSHYPLLGQNTLIQNIPYL